ncbi:MULTISPECIES: hypothetical protein [unclassified Flavobacterium]|uniref:hypothetical protein n=1 Tax=unclassified Flavobacterium TaxID=196869 RepID=UPI001F13AF8B|nr:MULTISPECIES: hypothetical protein [unclassified Flavobacterium]UMY64665.1 hypothetical protein MKO97_09085 [Flavobacterium sp. HJ-32-4]
MQGHYKKPVTICFISGIWTESNRVTHYAIHKFLDPGVTAPAKLTLEQVVEVIEKYKRRIFTWEWSYEAGRFLEGKEVFFKRNERGCYLYTAPYEARTKNLRHLLNLSWYNKTV